MCKISRPIVVLSVVTAFSLSAILCCCAMQLVHAPSLKSRSAMASDPCQKNSSSTKTTHHGYCFLQAPTADKVQLSSLAVPLYNFAHLSQAIVAFEHYVHQFSFVRTAYGGILLSQAQPIPLYIQNRNLRL